MLMGVMSVKTKELSEKATKGKKLMHKVKETGIILAVTSTIENG